MDMRTPPKEQIESTANASPDNDGKATNSVVSRPFPRERESAVAAPPRRRWAGAVSFLIVALAILTVTVYFAMRNPSRDYGAGAGPQQEASSSAERQKAPVANANDDSIISRIFGSDRPSADTAMQESVLFRVERMTARLLLAALLAALLAFRPHRYPGVLHRNPYVAQTEILLAVVAAALMMIVADNAARAFGIFAAASLVRFRTNIRDPKEITVLLINLAIGLAMGVGRWELAIILSLFVLLTLWVLEYYESRQVVRSMQLKVKTHNVASTDEFLQKIFGWHNLSAEVRQLDREDDKNPLGRIVYHVDVSPRVSTDRLSEEIFASDPHNIDTVEWHQKKSVSYTYR